jgi:uncharacterized protein with FMN-binding domain
MSNGSRRSAARRAEPGLIPRRGAAALLVTAGSLVLLLSFRTPDGAGLESGSPLLGQGDPGRLALAAAPSPGAAAVAASDPPVRSATPRVALGPPAPPPPPRATSPTDAPSPAPTATATPEVVTAAKQVVDGQVARTPYGDVQVEVTVKGGRVVDIVAIRLPDSDRHSRRISEIVGPMLHDDAIQVGDGRIHGVSGATYTSMGYARSLQSAMDQAGA